MAEVTMVECTRETSNDLTGLDAVTVFQVPRALRVRPDIREVEEAARIRDFELLAGVER